MIYIENWILDKIKVVELEASGGLFFFKAASGVESTQSYGRVNIIKQNTPSQLS